MTFVDVLAHPCILRCRAAGNRLVEIEYQHNVHCTSRSSKGICTVNDVYRSHILRNRTTVDHSLLEIPGTELRGSRLPLIHVLSIHQ